MRSKTKQAATPLLAQLVQPNDYIGAFSLAFLDYEPAFGVAYEDELLTAEEKAAFYDDL